MAHITTDVVDEPVEVGTLIASAATPSCGAVASFVGTVRESPSVDAHAGKAVVGLEYESHPTLAREKLAGIATEAADKWGLERVVAVHRTGRCELGEATIVIACSAPHRAEALDACRWVIDEVKATVPIWKKEIYADGSSWVGAGP